MYDHETVFWGRNYCSVLPSYVLVPLEMGHKHCSSLEKILKWSRRLSSQHVISNRISILDISIVTYSCPYIPMPICSWYLMDMCTDTWSTLTWLLSDVHLPLLILKLKPRHMIWRVAFIIAWDKTQIGVYRLFLTIYNPKLRNMHVVEFRYRR